MNWKHITTFLMGIVLTFIVISVFGLYDTLNVLAHANYGILFAALLVQIGIFALLVMRIKVIAEGRGYLSYWHATRVTLSGMFVSMLTPLMKLGGEPLKMYMLKRAIGSNNASASIALESVMEILSSIFVVFTVMIIFLNHIPAALISTFLIFLIVLGAGAAIFLKILFTPRWLNKIVNWASIRLAKLMEVKKKDYTDIFTTAFYEMWKNKSKLLATFSVSVLSKIAEILRFWLVFLALGVLLPFQTVVIVWTILLVILFIPWLPGSLGLAELGGISALIAFGVSPSVAASAIILDRFLSLWFPLAVGFIALSWAKRKGELPDFNWKKEHSPGTEDRVQV